MPSFDLKGIRCGKYVNTSGTITYTGHCAVGDAMNCNLELKYAEGRLYAESTLAEYLKLATGGSISIAVKYIKEDAAKLMYGATATSRTVSEKAVTGLKYTAKDIGDYVGVAFYAPDKIDGATKYTCVFITKALFGPPSMNFQTKGDNIQFNTPTTSGEFLADDSTTQELLETAVCDTETEAIAWTKAVLGET